LPVPYSTPTKNETTMLSELIANAKSVYGSSYFEGLYYPSASYCYAYEPSSKDDTKDEFKAHNWWIPSGGELLRYGFYYKESYNPNNSEDVINPLNIFKKAIAKGIMSKFTSGSQYRTVNEVSSASTQTLMVHHPTWNSWFPNSITKTATKNPVRPICAF
jgi:hypothetical protein